MKLTANGLNPLVLPVFPLPTPAFPSPLQRKNTKRHRETEERNDLPVFLLEYIQRLQVTPPETLKTFSSNLQVSTVFSSSLFWFCNGYRLNAAEKGLRGKLPPSRPSFPRSTDGASKPAFRLGHSQRDPRRNRSAPAPHSHASARVYPDLLRLSPVALGTGQLAPFRGKPGGYIFPPVTSLYQIF